MINDLINQLRLIEATYPEKHGRWLSDTEFAEGELPIENALSLACGALITPRGECNWDNINKLKEAGFHVGPGEQDSFGWLSGVIYTRAGRICYG